ncbi:hypothetical protein MNEG_6207 [Monoraphidium neglectum]|uniref:Glycoside-hydrolase family GH114 TIM-barrel domain-containing protein n=1 Tax=Monoraphidium neglectum TaxID=145388 RepID=A0A0D2JRY6_9CHLO|nr:hypothetical protein MNEG_6207 [Monoraphidium neglectum]KIZ01753.1 hypothetical protein MNEG_6207 [Monoraphidium neglectum]|eukprot:XP_013900772.1 hypothetical protein MNEG_6207 [Monoraphidium neglectum]
MALNMLLALLAMALAASTAGWWKPPKRIQWQWQLSPFNYPADLVKGPDRLDMYDVDVFDNTATTIRNIKSRGVRVMCYFEAGTWPSGKVNNPFLSQYPARCKGKPYEPPYTDELWLDITCPEVLNITRKILDLAVTKGCDGVEPDNVQGFETDSGYNTGFYKCPIKNGVQTGYTTGCDLDYKEWRGFNLFLANEAHARNLSIALKNNFYMAPEMAAVHDMVLSEQCYQYGECANYTSFINAGKPVLLTEYRRSNGWPLKTCRE